jgi:hypothetical protein
VAGVLLTTLPAHLDAEKGKDYLDFIYGTKYKVHIYLEYHSVETVDSEGSFCRLWQIFQICSFVCNLSLLIMPILLNHHPARLEWTDSGIAAHELMHKPNSTCNHFFRLAGAAQTRS